MGFIVTDLGEEFETRSVWKPSSFTKPSSVTMGLYLDSTDSISDSDDLSAITTEPSGSAYARQSISLDSSDITIVDNTNGDWTVEFADQTFDLSDSSQNIDGYFIVANFLASDTGDSSANDHLILTGALDQEYDGSQTGSAFTVTDSGRSAD